LQVDKNRPASLPELLISIAWEQIMKASGMVKNKLCCAYQIAPGSANTFSATNTKACSLYINFCQPNLLPKLSKVEMTVINFIFKWERKTLLARSYIHFVAML
jgi:hypothetical protein